MERSCVHIAVLVVAEDPATVDLASATFLTDKVMAAGHRVVAQEIVETNESAIRDQLARWISQGHIDVVMSAGAGEPAVAALGPLVTAPLQGMTDQLRLLARDRGGEGKPAAARCTKKFVFLLPAQVNALGAVLNQLVLPQLDSTQPRNLVSEMPRHGAVPQTLPSEKTASGAGLVPKLPAADKRKTGANVISRGARIDDPTKPIELESLERRLAEEDQQAARFPAQDAVTRPHIDLASMLPPVPPGADLDTAETEALPDHERPGTWDDVATPPPLTVQPARLRTGPIGVAGNNDKTVVRPTPANDAKTVIRPAPTRPGNDDKTAVRPAPTRPASQTNRGVQPTPAIGAPSVKPGPIGVAKTATPAIGAPTVKPAMPPSSTATPSIGSPTVKPATAPLPKTALPSLGSPTVKPASTATPSIGSPTVKPASTATPSIGSPTVKPASTATPSIGSPTVKPVTAALPKTAMPSIGSPTVKPAMPPSSTATPSIGSPTVKPVTAPLPKTATPSVGSPTVKPAASSTAPAAKPQAIIVDSTKEQTTPGVISPLSKPRPVPGSPPPTNGASAATSSAGAANAAVAKPPATPVAGVAKQSQPIASVATPPSGVAKPQPVATTSPASSGLEVVDAAALAAAVDAEADEELDPASSADILEAVPASPPHAPPPVPTAAAAHAPPPVPRAPARPAIAPQIATSATPIDPRAAEAKLAAQAKAAAPPVTRLANADLPSSPQLSQPELLDFSEGVAKNRRSRTGTALVRKKRSSALMYLALLAAAAAGFVAVVHFFPHNNPAGDGNGSDRGARGSNVVAVVTPPVGSADTGSAEPAQGSDTGSAGSTSEHTPATAEHTPAPAEHTGTATHGTSHPSTHPAGTPEHATPEHAEHATAEHAAPEHATPEHAAAEHATPEHATAEHAAAEPPPEDGCDEVSCVLDKYQRDCCARFKPADGGAFHPKNEVPDALDRSMVLAGIEKVKPKVISCGEKIAAKGTVKLAITVAPEGNISNISVSESPDPALGDCVLAAVKRATFGKSVNGATFTFPFAF